MKYCLLLIIALSGTNNFAQLQPFTDPEFGRFEPKFLHQDYLIGNNYTESGEFNGIYKLNLSNGETTPFSFGEQGSFVMPSTDNRNTHQDNIYVSSYPGLGFRKMSLSENYVYDYLTVDGYSINGTIFKDRIYFNFYLNATYYYDLLAGELVLLSDHPTGGILFHNMLAINNNMLAIRNLTHTEESQQGSRLLKFDSSYEVVDYIENTLNPEGAGDYITALQQFAPNGRITINGRELFLAQMHTGVNRLLSIAPNNFQSTNFISDALDINIQMDYIVLPDGVIFSINGNFYKTDGISSLEQINTFNNIGIFEDNFRAPSPYNLFQLSGSGNAFVHMENETYFKTISSDQVEHIYKISSIHDSPELVYSAVHNGSVYEILRYATDWNGNLLFVVQSNDATVADQIYLYNGVELILNPILNDYLGKTTNEQSSIVGLFTHGNLLLVNTEEGVYSIEYDDMSISDQIITYKLKLYPNPVKDILHLSEKASEIKVYDLSGKLIKTHLSKTDKLYLTELPKGNYILSGTNQQGEKFSSKFIRQ